MTQSERPIVLVLMGALWPGNEATGPRQSLMAMCAELRGEYAFKIVARDRGRSPAAPPLAPSGEWISNLGSHYYYCRSQGRRISGLNNLLRNTTHDLLLLNGYFDREFTIPALILRRLGGMPRTPTILTPRGEFSPGALALKAPPKRAYLAMARAAGLIDDVWLHATAASERDDIAAALPWARHRILLASNIHTLPPAPEARPKQTSGWVRLAFLSRISPKKNLYYGLKLLSRVRAPTLLDIIGPVSDATHWQACQALIKDLPDHIKVQYRGVLAHADVHETLAGYDGFLLPTRGENYGHAIIDALAAACPIIISDQTPWRDLQSKHAGWSLPLDEPQAFAHAIDELALMPDDAHARLRAGARRLAETIIRDADAVAATRAMFETVLASAHRKAT